MAGELTQKKIENLGEVTEPVDADVFLHGSGGGNVIKKISWGNLVKKLRSLLFVNNTTTTVEGYGVDARVAAQQQKEIDDLNTKMLKTKFLEVSINTTANQDANITVDWGVGSGQTIVAHFVQKVVGSTLTTNILFCEFTSSTNIRIKSASSQKVTVGIVCLYR
jgi:hypothetical protein